MTYIEQGEFIETNRLVNINPTDGKETPGFDFNDWDSRPIAIRKSDICVYGHEGRNATHVTMRNGTEFVLVISYEQFKQKML